MNFPKLLVAPFAKSHSSRCSIAALILLAVPLLSHAAEIQGNAPDMENLIKTATDNSKPTVDPATIMHEPSLTTNCPACDAARAAMLSTHRSKTPDVPASNSDKKTNSAVGAE